MILEERGPEAARAVAEPAYRSYVPFPKDRSLSTLAVDLRSIHADAATGTYARPAPPRLTSDAWRLRSCVSHSHDGFRDDVVRVARLVRGRSSRSGWLRDTIEAGAVRETGRHHPHRPLTNSGVVTSDAPLSGHLPMLDASTLRGDACLLSGFPRCGRLRCREYGPCSSPCCRLRAAAPRAHASGQRGADPQSSIGPAGLYSARARTSCRSPCEALPALSVAFQKRWTFRIASWTLRS